MRDLGKALEKLDISVEAPQFPDARLARSEYWLPFLENELQPDNNTIIIGHSSGAIAAMRYAETHRILGSALIAAYHTDLGIETEKVSGYFDHPSNQGLEAHFIRDQLQTDYHESPDQGHFGGDDYKETFPELLEEIKRKL